MTQKLQLRTVSLNFTKIGHADWVLVFLLPEILPLIYEKINKIRLQIGPLFCIVV